MERCGVHRGEVRRSGVSGWGAVAWGAGSLKARASAGVLAFYFKAMRAHRCVLLRSLGGFRRWRPIVMHSGGGGPCFAPHDGHSRIKLRRFRPLVRAAFDIVLCFQVLRLAGIRLARESGWPEDSGKPATASETGTSPAGSPGPGERSESDRQAEPGPHGTSEPPPTSRKRAFDPVSHRGRVPREWARSVAGPPRAHACWWPRQPGPPDGLESGVRNSRRRQAGTGRA